MKFKTNTKNSIYAFMMASVIAATALFPSCSKKEGAKKDISVAVFIPGIIADSPTYAHVAEGVTQAVDNFNSNNGDSKSANGGRATLYVMEAGTNQAEWSTKLTALAAEGCYDVIISSNPSMPALASPIAKQFPEQKFIFLDAALEEGSKEEQIYCISYNQRDQAYVSGYIAGLYSSTNKVGLIAAQEYPIMNNILYPYFARGAQDANPKTESFFSIVGNWYDASKGAELCQALSDKGVDVVLPICGGASQGVISAAKEKNMHIVWFDENGFKKAPGTIISCCMTDQAKAASEVTTLFLTGDIPWGTTKTVGMADGYVQYFHDDPEYIKAVDGKIRAKMDILVELLKSGALDLGESADEVEMPQI